MRRSRLTLAMIAVLAGAACAPDEGAGDPAGDPSAAPPALELLAGSPSPHGAGDDVWEVWICRVPPVVGHPVYADDTWRMEHGVDDLVAFFDNGVGEWFSRLSHGRYRPVFRHGGEVSITGNDDGYDCVDRAVGRTRSGTEGVLVVADALHRDGVSGGWGRPGVCGDPCTASAASESGRAVYVGAADFAPEWGERPPLDLVQHELGHTLDLPHSGDGSGDDHYTSPIDMMSDSAAPRQVRPERRDGPGTLGANRVALGWLPLDDVVIVTSTTERIELVASSSPTGDRLAVVPLDRHRLVTFELLVPSGANDHLPAAGVAVHLVDQAPSACKSPQGLCTGQYRRQTTLVDDVRHPGIPLIGPGVSIDVGSFTARVISIDGERVALAIEAA